MPLGFHEDILLRAMTRLRVHREDLVYVVTCSPLVGGVKLKKHLELTANLVKHLVETRFPPYTIRDVLPEVFKYIDPIDFTYTIGLLHGVGKASMYYLEHYVESLKRPKGEFGEKISFPYHECALALMMLHAIDMHATELDEASLAGMDLCARIISRHHSAMPDRHTTRIRP